MKDKIILKVETAGTRVDAYLASCLKEYSRGYFQRLIDMGHVLVNSQKTASSCRLKEGDEIEIIREGVLQNVRELSLRGAKRRSNHLNKP